MAELPEQNRTVDAQPKEPSRRFAGRDPDRLEWPPTRTDFLTLILISAFAYCLLDDRSVAITVPVLVATVFVGVSPRMRGRWGWQSGTGSSLGGEFGDPFEEATRAGADQPRRLDLGPGSPPRKGSAED